MSTTQAAITGQSGSGGSETENFCYDEQNRLVWAGNSGTQPGAGHGTCGTGTLANSLSGASYNSNYTYTHLGQQWQAPINGTQRQYLYCNSSHPHQLTGIYPSGTTCSSLSGASYQASYDNWGNEASRTYNGTTATLSYDVLDELVQWNAGSTNQAWYAYGTAGERALQRSTTGSGTSLTVYAFGLEEHVYNAAGTNTGNTYYYTLGGRLVGELVGTQTHFFLTDVLGSVLARISNTANGAAVEGNQNFGPYGNTQYTSGTIGTTQGFTGQYQDATGLDYYGARYYDPVSARFVSADTSRGNGIGMDPYAYVRGNPETYSDPSGHAEIDEAGVGGGLGAADTGGDSGLDASVSSTEETTSSTDEAQSSSSELSAAEQIPTNELSPEGQMPNSELQDIQQSQEQESGLHPTADTSSEQASSQTAETSSSGETSTASETATASEQTTTSESDEEGTHYWSTTPEAQIDDEMAHYLAEQYVPGEAKGNTTVSVATFADPASEESRTFVSVNSTVMGRGFVDDIQQEVENLGATFIDEKVTSDSHAEVNILENEATQGLQLRGIGASNYICPECGATILRYGGYEVVGTPIKAIMSRLTSPFDFDFIPPFRFDR